MALPFVALWALWPFDAVAGRGGYLLALQAVLAIAITASFVRNIQVLGIGNHRQLELVGRAEALLGPNDVYFDGVGMLPDRREPSTLWLDRHAILQTMRQGRGSELFRIFSRTPPRLIIWSYRMDAVDPLVGPLIRDSYVQFSPNLRMAGRLLKPGDAGVFDVPVAGEYALYDRTGRPASAALEIDGAAAVRSPVALQRGRHRIALRGTDGTTFLLPEGTYRKAIRAGPDNPDLFSDVYN
jgi:hypothetical protein